MLHAGDDGDSGLSGLNVSLRLLDTRGHGCGSATGLIRLIARCASLLLQPLRPLARLFRLGSSCFQGGLFLPKARLPCTSKDDARSCSRQARSCDRQCRANARCDNR
jgi:hypothetical protein